MTEKEFEDILCKYPELIEKGLQLLGRQISVQRKLVDIVFTDRYGQKLIIELKKGTIVRKHLSQLLDYEGYFLSPDDLTVRVMLVGNRVPNNFRRSLEHHGIEWKELPIIHLINFLNEKQDHEFMQYFDTDMPIRRLTKNSVQRKLRDKNDFKKSLSEIMEISKHNLGEKSVELVRKKLEQHLGFNKLQINRTSKTYKSTLLINIGENEIIIHVKSKRIRVFPNVKGINGKNKFIVFVDYFNRESFDHADYYIVDSKEWKKILDQRLDQIINKKPNERIEIDKSTNTPIFVDQLQKSGKPYKGIDINVSLLHPFKDSWSKITDQTKQSSQNT